MGVPNGEMDNVHRGWRNGLRNGGYAMDFVPVIGDGKGFIEALVGTDMQGNKMSWFDRGLSILFLSELRDAKNIDKAIDAVKAGDNAKGAAKGIDYVVTPKGEAIKIPDGATGPTNPNKGSGMVYQGGSGGKGMDSRTTGVRIMDANSNQGRRVNYMNKSGQTVDPSTGRTISNKDPRGHLPLKDY